jgi:hypothetical protein
VIKAQGIPKGGHVEKIGGPIRFTAVRREPLRKISAADVIREGFRGLSPAGFVELYRQANGGDRDQIVTRIEFEYLCEQTPAPSR